MSGPPQAVFLSYASQDAAAAGRIFEALRGSGIEVWFDQSELRGGDAWDQRIRREIRECSLFMPIISANTQARVEGYFRLEWRLADQRTHLMGRSRAFLVPVCVDETSEADADVPDSFAAVQWTRLPNGATTPAFTARIAALLGAPVAASGGTSAPVAPEAAAPAMGARSASRMRLAAIALAAFVAVLLAYVVIDRFAPPKHTRPERPLAAVAPAATPPTPKITEKSVAVLPFVDMSEKKDQEYFADGIAEEILNQLSRISDLRVIARTSSFSFKGKSDDIPTIGQKLRAATILEGSVRRSASRIRVTTQLVRAATGEQVWSNSYERDFKDVLGIQADIASSVARALKAMLVENFSASSAGTGNVEAYDLLLQSKAIYRSRASASAEKEAIELTRRSLAIDPAYADAWVVLSILTDNLMYYAKVGDRARLALDAENFARRAVEAQPGRSDSHTAYARALVSNFKLASAREQIETALRLGPNEQWAVGWAGVLALLDGQAEEAVRLSERSIELDPENKLRRRDLGFALRAAGRYPEAEAAYRRYVAERDDPDTLCEWAWLRLDAGSPAGALELLEGKRKLSVRNACGGFSVALARLGRRQAAQAALRDLESDAGNALEIAFVLAQRGDTDGTFRYLNAAIANRTFEALFIKWYPALEPIRRDPRFAELVERLGLPP